MPTAFGVYLRKLLRERGWTQNAFADKVGRSRGNLSNIIKGEGYAVQEEDMDRWADILGLSGYERERFLNLACITHIPQKFQGRFVAIVDQAEKATEVVRQTTELRNRLRERGLKG